MHGKDQEPSKEQDGGLNIRNKLVPTFPTTLFGPAGRIFMDGDGMDATGQAVKLENELVFWNQMGWDENTR